MRLTLGSLGAWLSQLTLEEAYAKFESDYSGQRARPRPALTGLLQDGIAWRRDPTSEEVRRFFNQVNAFYAEREIRSRPDNDPLIAITACHDILIYRQGKSTGLRTRNIEYGVRSHLDFMDPWRRERWLRGLPPEQLPRAMLAWGTAVDNVRPSLMAAVFLSIALIALHPFSDANGRAARLAFTWLCDRWGIDRWWLNEADDGEVFITGDGLQGTTYLMAMVAIEIMQGYNVISPGDSGNDRYAEAVKCLSAFLGSMAKLTSTPDVVLSSPSLVALFDHMRSEGHFVLESPRFKCLSSCIEE